MRKTTTQILPLRSLIACVDCHETHAVGYCVLDTLASQTTPTVRLESSATRLFWSSDSLWDDSASDDRPCLTDYPTTALDWVIPYVAPAIDWNDPDNWTGWDSDEWYVRLFGDMSILQGLIAGACFAGMFSALFAILLMVL